MPKNIKIEISGIYIFIGLLNYKYSTIMRKLSINLNVMSL